MVLADWTKEVADAESERRIAAAEADDE